METQPESRFDEVLAYIDAHADGLVADLQEMIRTKSVNPSFDAESPGEAAMARLVESHYRRLGIPTERVEPVRGRPSVLARWTGAPNGPRVLVNCHLDTVAADVGEWYDPFTGAPAGEWRMDAFAGVRDGDRIYGRGAADHKSPIAALIHALHALRACGVELHGELTCIHDADEETGGEHGMRHLATTRPFDFDMVLYACSSEFTNLGRTFFSAMGRDNVLRAFAGWHTYRIRVRGQNLHNLTPKRGYGAVEAALELIAGLHAHRDRINAVVDSLEGTGQPAFRISSIDCGPRSALHHQANWCDIVVNRRISPSIDPAVAIGDLQSAVDAHNQAFPDNPAEWVLLRDQRAFETPADHPVVTGMADAVRTVTGREPTVAGLPAPVGISAMLNTHALPTILFGYGYLNMHHAPNEHIEVDSLVDMAKVYAVALMKWMHAPSGATPA